MQVASILSRPVISVVPQDRISWAAALMQDHDIGALAVLDGTRPVGVVTDRDLVVRALTVQDDTRDHTVGDLMSRDPVFCYVDQTIAEAAAIMGDAQIRRLLILDRSEKLAGILSVGDIAENASEELAGQALGEITETRRPRL